MSSLEAFFEFVVHNELLSILYFVLKCSTIFLFGKLRYIDVKE